MNISRPKQQQSPMVNQHSPFGPINIHEMCAFVRTEGEERERI